VCWFALQPERPKIDESWLLQALDHNDLSALQLARGTPAAGADCSALVCSCHQVREAKILAAIADGCDSVERIGACTRAGTNCGSCIPDLRRLLTNSTVAEALC
jgi:assimilatory nitrate reductase catalytic subunit